MSERREVFARIRLPESDPNRLTVTAAAKLLGISRTRINQLMKKQDKAPAPAPAAPAFKVVSPSAPTQERPAAAPAPSPAPTNPDAPPTGPVDLKAVLDGAGGPAAPQATPVEAVRMDGIDPDDAEAGRELLSWLRRGVAEFAAKFVYKAKADDPRLEKLKEENKFLKVALKRNSDKAAPLGWFTKGWVGLVVGFGIEFVKVALTFPAPAQARPAAGATPKPVEEAPTAPPVTTVEEVRAEADGPRRLTIEERLKLYNEGK